MERDGLRFLDQKGVTELLLSHTLDGEPEGCEISLFPGHEGTKLAARTFPGEPDSVHFIYLPAEYDTARTLGLLAGQCARAGFTFVAMDYRGCGLSEGQPSLEATSQDVVHFFDFVTAWMEIEGRTGPLVVMGRSIGTAFALDLAAREQDRLLCLVLDSAFDRSRDFLLGSGVASEVLEELPGDKAIFGNRQTMGSFKKPVLFIHSPRDTVQSLTQVEWLVAASRSKATQFQLAPAGTRQELAQEVNDLYGDVLIQYVNLRRGVRPRIDREKRRRRRMRNRMH